MSKKELFSNLLGREEPTGAQQKSNLVNDIVSNGQENANSDVNDDVNGDVNKNVNVNVSVSPRRTKREKFEDKHTRQTYYIDNEILELLNEVAGNEKGEKTRIVNEALRRYLKAKSK